MSGRRPYVPTQSDLARRQRVYLDAPGLYAITLAKGAPEVAAEVRHEPTSDPWLVDNEMDRSYWWTVVANGRVHRGPMKEPDWTITGRSIDEDEFFYLLDDRAWAARYAPQLPEASPHKPVNLRAMNPRDLLK